MKKWGFLLCIILVGYIVTQSTAPLQQKEGVPIVILDTDEKYRGYHEATTQDMKQQIHKGNLVLVNSKHPIHPEGIRSDVVYVADEEDLLQGYGIMDQTLMLSREVTAKFQKMVEAAGKEGVRYFLMSAGTEILRSRTSCIGKRVQTTLCLQATASTIWVYPWI